MYAVWIRNQFYRFGIAGSKCGSSKFQLCTPRHTDLCPVERSHGIFFHERTVRGHQMSFKISRRMATVIVNKKNEITGIGSDIDGRLFRNSQILSGICIRSYRRHF